MINGGASKIIWDALKHLLSADKDIEFYQDDNSRYCISPLSLKWKNFFLMNSFWPYHESTHYGPFVYYGPIKKFETIGPTNMDLDQYISEINDIQFTILLSDEKIDSKIIDNEDLHNVILLIQNNNKIEECASNLVAKVYFAEAKGYLVGNFSIPSFDPYSSGYGIPDIIGIKGGFVNLLKGTSLFNNGGYLENLLLLPSFDYVPSLVNEEIETMVCEVKSSTSWKSGFSQLYIRGNDNPGYLKSRCFDKGYACFGSYYNHEDWDYMWEVPAAIEAGSLIIRKDYPYIEFNEDSIVNIENASSARRRNLTLNDRKELLVQSCERQAIELIIQGLVLNDYFPKLSSMTESQRKCFIDTIKIKDLNLN